MDRPPQPLISSETPLHHQTHTHLDATTHTHLNLTSIQSNPHYISNTRRRIPLELPSSPIHLHSSPLTHHQHRISISTSNNPKSSSGNTGSPHLEAHHSTLPTSPHPFGHHQSRTLSQLPHHSLLTPSPSIRRRPPAIILHHPMAYASHHPILSTRTLSPGSSPSSPRHLHLPLLNPLRLPSSPGTPRFPRRRRTWLDYTLILLLLVVAGTVIVLSTANAYFGIHSADLVSTVDLNDPTVASAARNVPKIIHQTWKTNVLPDRWQPVRASCAALHPDWEYMLWTDASGRELIESHYAWFLDTFDGYRYPIQRADAVRYFVLHRYGGVYMDLDIGCVRPMDSLLAFDLLLPQTIPVGVSNDLMFSTKGHPFMDYVIHRLAHFDHDYLLNYPTVMFSTGPMAISALLSQFRASPPLHSPADVSAGPVRVLSPELYGKNLAPEASSSAFFTHYYGSSWHTDDARPIVWLGKFGIFWLYAASGVLGLCMLRYVLRLVRSIVEDRVGGWSGARVRRRRRSSGEPVIIGHRFTDVLLLPVAWLEERRGRSSRRAHVGRCKCCGWTDAPPTSPSEAGLPAYESDCRTPGTPKTCESDSDESDSDDDRDLFLTTPTPIPMPSKPTLHGCSSRTTGELTLPLQKAIYRLAEITRVVTSPGYHHPEHYSESDHESKDGSSDVKAD